MSLDEVEETGFFLLVSPVAMGRSFAARSFSIRGVIARGNGSSATSDETQPSLRQFRDGLRRITLSPIRHHECASIIKPTSGRPLLA